MCGCKFPFLPHFSRSPFHCNKTNYSIFYAVSFFSCFYKPHWMFMRHERHVVVNNCFIAHSVNLIIREGLNFQFNSWTSWCSKFMMIQLLFVFFNFKEDAGNIIKKLLKFKSKTAALLFGVRKAEHSKKTLRKYFKSFLK